MSMLRQTATTILLGFQTLPARWKAALSMIAGIACMIFALLSILAIAESIRLAITTSGAPERAVIHAAGDEWLGDGRLPPGLTAIVAKLPHVRLAVGEIHFGVGKLVKRNNSEDGDTNLIGIEPEWLREAGHIHLLSGRLPGPGTRDVIVGRYAVRKFAGTELGRAIRFSVFLPGRPPIPGAWRVVGIYTTGDWWDGYIIGDYGAVKQATHQRDSAIRIRLDAPANFDAVRSALASRLPPGLIVERETDFYVGFWRIIPKLIYVTSFLIGALTGTGAIAATTFTVQVAIEARASEIAVLRVSGFDPSVIALSLAIEAVALAAVGALIATGLVWLWLDGFLYNGAGSVFQIVVGTHILLIALSCATVVALLGTLPTMVRIVRQPAIQTMRDL
ncbi:MAG TPA: ABC transporter permease [Rhizomicrobium sp.]|jgi:cell division protein FtsX|nr:ABC transporter permease [Rhizomicrobium sp.]